MKKVYLAGKNTFKRLTIALFYPQKISMQGNTSFVQLRGIAGVAVK
jgi:hypothetical protein